MQMSNCDRCYRRKGKCDKLQPCGSCERAGVPCIYTDRTKERRYTADHVERLEKRIRQAEARNRSLADELSRVRSSNEGQTPAHQSVEPGTSQTSARTVDAVSEVSYLSISAAGERLPYLGSTSGILFADLVRASVDAPVPGNASATPGLSPPGSEQSIVSNIQPPTSPRNREDLPPHTLASKLVAAYLEHENIAYPFIFPMFLIETAERFYNQDGYYVAHASPYESFIFSMVLAIATTQVAKFDWQSLPSAESHQVRAMNELNPVLAHGSVESLQALLLICQYRTSSSVKDSSASMWHTVGIAGRMCLELGLHRESAYPIKKSSNLDASKLNDFRNQELGRRCFWCVVAMDRITSNILGRPLGIADEDIDTALPSVESDALLTRPLASTIAGVQRIAVFNKLMKYRMFCGKLLTTLHRKRTPSMSIEDALKTRDELADELDMWYSSLRELELPDPSSHESREQSCFLSPTWYEVLYANANLMIWRPCPLLADMPHDRSTLQRIFDSSTHAINTYAILHKSRQINYSWVTLQSVFMAGLSYIYAVSRHMRDRRNLSASNACLLDRDPSTIDVVNVTRACSNVLVAVAERWNTQRHCHEVFDRLSDAVLADAIKLQTAAGYSQHMSPAASPSTSMSSPLSVMPPPSGPVQRQLPPMPPPNQLPYWSNHQQHPSQPQTPYSTTTDPTPLAVDNEFLHCYDDLQHLYHQQQLEDPVMHLSQDWLGNLGGSNQGQYVTNVQAQYQLPQMSSHVGSHMSPQVGSHMNMS